MSHFTKSGPAESYQHTPPPNFSAFTGSKLPQRLSWRLEWYFRFFVLKSSTSSAEKDETKSPASGQPLTCEKQGFAVKKNTLFTISCKKAGIWSRSIRAECLFGPLPGFQDPLLVRTFQNPDQKTVCAPQRHRAAPKQAARRIGSFGWEILEVLGCAYW